MKKILGITGIRSDYDLMSTLYKALVLEPGVDFRLLVGGAHMSRTYGHTIDLIREDGVPILISVESLIDSDTPSSRLKTASTMLHSVIDVVANWSPDLILVAGDREEVWIGAMLGTYLEIPIVHFYAGDHTRTGHVDNPIRHAVSKLATAHFVAMDEHKRRLVAIGEDPCRISVIGNLSLDNFVNQPPLPWGELASRLGFQGAPGGYAMVLFHPDPSEKSCAGQYMADILECLSERGILACVGYPNTDPANKDIIQVIEDFHRRSEIFVYRNLARSDFISLYKNSSFIIGNSSSGILEAASIPLPAINVGLRQRGRVAAENVIFCDANRASIRKAIEDADSTQFRAKIQTLKNPYGIGNSTARALQIIIESDFNQNRLKSEDPLDCQLFARQP